MTVLLSRHYTISQMPSSIYGIQLFPRTANLVSGPRRLIVLVCLEKMIECQVG